MPCPQWCNRTVSLFLSILLCRELPELYTPGTSIIAAAGLGWGDTLGSECINSGWIRDFSSLGTKDSSGFRGMKVMVHGASVRDQQEHHMVLWDTGQMRNAQPMALLLICARGSGPGTTRGALCSNVVFYKYRMFSWFLGNFFLFLSFSFFNPSKHQIVF